MRTILCLGIMLAFATAATAATADDLKAAQETADGLIKAVMDKDFDAFKDKCSTKMVEKYNANNENCEIKRWYDGARDEVDKHGAKWEFVKVKNNYPTQVNLDYKRTMDTGETICTLNLVKEGDKWLVDAAGSL